MERAASQLSSLLQVTGEQDIRRHLAGLLEELGAGTYSLEVRAGTGAADLVCHQYRVVIETKARGEADPTKFRTGANETQQDQVARYVAALSLGRLDFDAARPWRGFLTDGHVWWGWEWRLRGKTSDPANGRLVRLPHVQGITPVDSIEQFGQLVDKYLAPAERRGAPAPPSPLRPVFEPFLAELRTLLPEVETEPFFETKFGLWLRTLQGSGLVGPGSIGQALNFAEHTILVVAARMIVLAAEDGTRISDLPAAVADGFSAWLSDFPAGVDLLGRLAESVAEYDWRAVDRDLLKELYHDLIDRDDRKEFGEYYTPDWLAEDVVEKVLLRNPRRLDEAIQTAALALDTKGVEVDAADDSFAVLDPACGSGTFLFWTARAIAKRIRSSHPRLAGRTRELVAAMVVGLDVHPVAVEMARATLATALPRGSAVPLRVFLADSLLPAAQSQKTLTGTLSLVSARGQQIDIPAEIIESPRAGFLVDTLVGAAAGQHALRDSDVETQELLGDAVTQLAKAIAAEGDHVWRWYIGNQIAPSTLARRKVMAIVTNPPWLVANDTPEGTRKNQLAAMSERYRLRPRARWSAKGDLASVFSARAVDLYLAEGGTFGLVLPGSALINQTWAKWRTGSWGNAVVGFEHLAKLDDVTPPPFRHAPNGTCVVIGTRSVLGATRWTDAESLVYSGDPEIPTVTISKRRPSKPSPYVRRFKRGAVAQPLGLCLVLDPVESAGRNLKHITTKASTKGNWKGVQFSAVVEEEALVRALRSQTLEAFVCAPDAWYIAPLSQDRNRLLQLDEPEFIRRLPRTHEYWTLAEERYLVDRAETAGATLSDNVDYQRTLTNQLSITASRIRRKVFYNKSGNTLRACRGPTSLVADDKCYWFVAASDKEALYLTAILNAACLQDSWRESKTSRMHFDTSPLKHVPVPAFDPKSNAHRRIAELSKSAEENPDASRKSLERAVSNLLPNYAS